MAKLRFIEVPHPKKGNGLRYKDQLVTMLNGLLAEHHLLDSKTWAEYGHDAAENPPRSVTCLSQEWRKGYHATLLHVDGKPAAFSMTLRDGTYAAFWNFFVAKEFRKQGYGKAMMQHAIERARKQGCTELCLNVHAENEIALAMYRAAGFTPKMHTMSLHV